MQKHTNLQVKFIIHLLSIILVLSVFAGCNLGSSTSQKQVSTPLSAPQVRISSIQTNRSLTVRGEYHERDLITVGLVAQGSQFSGVSCNVSLQHLVDGSYVDTPDSPIASCSDIRFILAPGAGVYRLYAKITDGNSKTAETQQFLIVVPQSVSERPYLQASFTQKVSKNENNAYEVQLDATNSTVGETGDIVSYVWQYRLKQNPANTAVTMTENGPKTTVVVQKDGIYVVKLTITDAGGRVSTMTKQFDVGIANSGLEVKFTTTPSTANSTSGVGAAPVNLTVTSTSIVSAGVDHYIWQVYKSDALDTVIYELQTETKETTLPLIDPGTYLIKLIIIDKTGNEHDYSRLVTV